MGASQDIIIRLVAKDLFSRQMGAAGKQIKRVAGDMKKQFKGISKSVSGLQGAIIGLGAGAAIASLVRLNANFQKSMSEVQAVTSATGKQMSALSAEARRLGKTTKFSASEAAAGMAFLGRAGFSTDQILKSMNATLLLAASGNLELGSAADIASNIMSGFGVRAEETARIADALAKTAASANTTVLQLGEAMKFVAPVAGVMGISVEAAAAAIGILSNAGLQASLAGTGLRKVLSTLVKEADKVTRLFGQELNPETMALTDIISVMAAKGISAADALTLFGERGGPAILALVSDSKGLAKLTDDINSSAGAAKEMAAVMEDNLSGAAKTLSSSIQELGLVIGEAGLLSSLRAVADSVTSVARATGEWTKANPALTKSLIEIAGVVAVGATLTVGLALVVTLIGAIGVGGAAIIGAIAGIGLLILNLNKLRNAFDFSALPGTIALLFTDIGKVVLSGFVGLGDMINQAFINLAKASFSFGKDIAFAVSTGLESGIEEAVPVIIEPAGVKVSEALADGIRKGKPEVKKAIKAIVEDIDAELEWTFVKASERGRRLAAMETQWVRVWATGKSTAIKEVDADLEWTFGKSINRGRHLANMETQWVQNVATSVLKNQVVISSRFDQTLADITNFGDISARILSTTASAMQRSFEGFFDSATKGFKGMESVAKGFANALKREVLGALSQVAVSAVFRSLFPGRGGTAGGFSFTGFGAGGTFAARGGGGTGAVPFGGSGGAPGTGSGFFAAPGTPGGAITPSQASLQRLGQGLAVGAGGLGILGATQIQSPAIAGITGAISGALAGAAIGGPVGAVIGLGVGGTIATIASFFGERKSKAPKRAKKAIKIFQQVMESIAGLETIEDIREFHGHDLARLVFGKPDTVRRNIATGKQVALGAGVELFARLTKLNLVDGNGGIPPSWEGGRNPAGITQWTFGESMMEALVNNIGRRALKEAIRAVLEKAEAIQSRVQEAIRATPFKFRQEIQPGVFRITRIGVLGPPGSVGRGIIKEAFTPGGDPVPDKLKTTIFAGIEDFIARDDFLEKLIRRIDKLRGEMDIPIDIIPIPEARFAT